MGPDRRPGNPVSPALHGRDRLWNTPEDCPRRNETAAQSGREGLDPDRCSRPADHHPADVVCGRVTALTSAGQVSVHLPRRRQQIPSYWYGALRTLWRPDADRRTGLPPAEGALLRVQLL